MERNGATKKCATLEAKQNSSYGGKSEVTKQMETNIKHEKKADGEQQTKKHNQETII